MSFEDRLRAQMRSAEGSVPGRPLEWEETMDRARRSRRRYIATVAFATGIVAVVATASVIALTGGSGPERGLAPVGPGPTESLEPEETPSPTPEPEDTPPPPVETPSPEPDLTGPACSAADMSSTLVSQDGLPPEVADMRQQIVELAVVCDYEGLDALAREGREYFTFSFGETRSAARFWRQLENDGEPVMRNLVLVLSIDYTDRKGFEDVERLYEWPSASRRYPTDADWHKVVDAGVHTAEDVRLMKELGSGYLGWRASITDDGDWIAFVAGD
ncbi:MAG: hypothetical protein ACRDJV_14740 [Actinomycetota bacterium]